IHGADVFLGHDTTGNGIDKLIAGAGFVLWLDADMHVAILTTAAGLADKLAFAFTGGSNGFAIGDLWSTDGGLDLEFAFQPVHDNFEMQLAHARNNCLAGFLISTHLE